MKLFLLAALAIATIVISLLVMIRGWGLTVHSWPWVLGGIFWSAIATPMIAHAINRTDML
jgi:hypothetical protein